MRWPAWLYRLVPYLGRRAVHQDLDEELRLHLELERERQREAGVPETEALRAARRTLGNATLIRERTRDVWGWRWLDDLGRDVRQALRGLRRNTGFTATVVCVLAAGIGANSAMFGIVHGMLIRPLPYPDPDAIVRVGESSRVILTNTTLPALRAEAESFEQIAAYRTRPFDWAGADGATTLSGAWVSPALFPLLRARPQLGRLFTEGDARPGAERVALLSHGSWTRRFGSNPDIVGTVMALDDAPHTVVGVLAESFYFPSPDAEVWTPWVMSSTASSGPGEQPPALMLAFPALGRLRPGVAPAQAATEVRTILQRIDDDFLRGFRRAAGIAAGDTLEVDARVIPLQEEMVGEYRPALLALTAALALVLLIACSNVAGLSLARGVTRQRELALRAALGAGRGRVVRQLLTESMVLGLGGAAVGLAAAAALLRAVPALVPGYVARLDEVALDGVVLAFTLGLSVLVGLAFGAAPAFQGSRSGLVAIINDGSPQATGGFWLRRSNRTRAALAAVQVALAIVLLVGAGLLLCSFVELISIDRGYDPADVIAARTRNPDRGTPSRAFSDALFEEVQGIARLPGVAAVGLSSGLPLTSGLMGVTVSAAGLSGPADPSELQVSRIQVVSPGYFHVMRLRLRSGRLFTSLDGAGSPRVVVVNETFAREVFGGGPAVGQQVRIRDQTLEVIGVVADIRRAGLSEGETWVEAFLSMHQIGPSSPLIESSPFISVRTTGDPSAVIPLLRETAAAAHPRASIEDVMTMEARLLARFAQPRFYAVFAGFFAALALLVAVSGLYGLLSYTVAQRRREIGIRMALGAQPGDIVALVVRQGAALVAAGATAGLLAAAAVSSILESFLFGVTAADGLTFAGAPLVLAFVALVACWIPARRATRVDPMEVLRFE